MSDVVDKDMGHKKAIDAFLKADGVTAKVGILSGKDRYPPKGRQSEGTSVAKVAGIHQAAGGWHTQAIDGNMARFDRQFGHAQGALISGANPLRLMDTIADGAAEAMRGEVRTQGLVDTGLFQSSIQYKVMSTKQLAAERKAYRSFLSKKAKAQKRVGGRFA